MPIQELLQMLRHKPFRPFRVYVSDGAAYEVKHPDLCMPGARSVIIGLPAAESSEPIYDHYVNIDLVHIIRLEPVESTAQLG